jgi:hypothetical protein
MYTGLRGITNPEESANRSSLLCTVIIMALQRDNGAMIRTMRRDKLMGNVHLMEVTLTSWRVLFGLCKSLFL